MNQHLQCHESILLHPPTQRKIDLSAPIATHDLPAHLKIQPDDVAWLKAAEPAFEFWNNPEAAIYDQL